MNMRERTHIYTPLTLLSAHITVILIPLPMSILFDKRNEHVVSRMEADSAIKVDIDIDIDRHVIYIVKTHLYCYGVVPKGLLTFLGSFYKKVVKTTPGTLVYRFERQTARKKKIFLPKTLCPLLRM